MVLSQCSGMVIQDIRFQGINGEGKGIFARGFKRDGVHHLTLRRLTIEDGSIGLYFTHSGESEPNRYIIVEDCVIRNNSGFGWLKGAGSHFVVRNCELGPNGTHTMKDHNIYFNSTEAFLIEDNYAHHGAGSAFNTHDTSHTIIRRNRIHHNGVQRGAAIGMMWLHPHNTIHHVLIDANDFYANGLIYWGPQNPDKELPNDVTWRNNVFRENLRPLRYANMDGLRIYNNTFYGNGAAILRAGGTSMNVLIANNIFCPAPSEKPLFSMPDIGKVTWANNLLFRTGGNLGLTARAEGRDLTYDEWKAIAGERAGKFGDPEFADTDGGDLRLTTDSPAVDAGADLYAPSYDYAGTQRPPGAAPDIGAFERETQ
jgi:hypothetical protein